MPAPDSRIDAYLAELRAGLRGFAEVEVAEIVAELRGHIIESIATESSDDAVGAVLGRLGTPTELASLYAMERLFERANRTRSPWLLFRSIARWATFSMAGAFVLFGLVVGHVIAASFFLAALVKPFASDRVGLWRLASGDISLRLGFGGPPPQYATELLGWWIVPIGLLIGAGAFWLTVHFARYAIRRFRPALNLPMRDRESLPC